MSLTCILIPVYSENTQVLSEVLTGILESSSFDVIVCDDGSENVNEITSALDSLKTKFSNRIRYTKNDINKGQGYTLKKLVAIGLESGYKYFITMDADGQHRIEDALNIHKHLVESKVNAVIGSRFMLKEAKYSIPLKRKLVLYFANIVFRVFSIKTSDITSGLRVFDENVAKDIFPKLLIDRRAHCLEIADRLSKSKYKITDFPVIIEYSQYSLRKRNEEFRIFVNINRVSKI